jgi:hypothetical protein
MIKTIKIMMTHDADISNHDNDDNEVDEVDN